MPTFRNISLTFLTLRCLTLVAAIAGLVRLPFSFNFSYYDLLIAKGHPLFWSWANFDGIHYVLLSAQGYFKSPEQAFFPVYFLLIKAGSFLVGNPLLVGLLLSHIFLILALYVFYKLIRFDYSAVIAQHSLLFLLLFPTAFYFVSVYTESLFLFLLVLCFYLLRTKRWGWAALVGVVLTATRINGVFIVPVFWYEISRAISDSSGSLTKTPLITFLKPTKTHLWAFVPLGGLLGYMTYLYLQFGDPLMFFHVQSTFGAGRQTDTLVLLPQVFFRYAKMLLAVPFTEYIYFNVVLELVTTVLFIGLLLVGYRKNLRLSYLFFAACSLVLPTLTGTLSSMPRYVVLLFPAFIVLGMIKSSFVRMLLLAIFSVLLMVCTALFTRGYWIA